MAGQKEEGRARDFYGSAHYERLLALKAKYDLENVFRFTFPLVGEHAVAKVSVTRVLSAACHFVVIQWRGLPAARPTATRRGIPVPAW